MKKKIEKFGKSVLYEPLRYKYPKYYSKTEYKNILKRKLLYTLAKLQEAGINEEGISFPVLAIASRIPDMQAYHLLMELESEGKVVSSRKGRFMAFKLKEEEK